MAREFDAGASLWQLQIALRYPKSYNGDIRPLYDHTSMLVGALGVSLPPLTSIRQNPELLGGVWGDLSAIGGVQEQMVRFGRLAAGLTMTAKGQDLDQHPYSLLAHESRDILLSHGRSSEQVNSWLDNVRDCEDRAKVIAGAAAISDAIMRSTVGTVHAREALDETGPGRTVDVFISYSQKEAEIADELASLLRSRGLSVFLAHQTIAVGPSWEEQVADAARSCRIGVVVVSRASSNSDWVRYEIGALWALRKQVAPALIDVDPGDLPELLRKFQARPVSSPELRRSFCDEIAEQLRSRQ